MPEVVLDKDTNNIFTPGIHNQDSSQPPEDTGGACGPGCLLSEDNSVVSGMRGSTPQIPSLQRTCPKVSRASHVIDL